MTANPWTPGQTTLHRVLTAALLALTPPDAGIAAQAGYWLLLVLHVSGRAAPWPLVAAFAGCVALVLPADPLDSRMTQPVLLLAASLATIWRKRWSEFGLLVLLVGGWLLWSAMAEVPPTVLQLATFLAIVISPAWIPRRRDALPLTVFYDGECGFCHRSVQFLLKEDPDGAATRFAPLQGTTFAARVPAAERANLPDSIVVSDATGALLVRSAAALRIGAALGGYWRPLAAIAWLVPRPLRDAVYDAIARRRLRWFAKPEGHCPLLAPAERARFDP